MYTYLIRTYTISGVYTGFWFGIYRTHSYLGACAYTTTGRKYVLITKYELIFQMCLYKEGNFSC